MSTFEARLLLTQTQALALNDQVSRADPLHVRDAGVCILQPGLRHGPCPRQTTLSTTLTCHKFREVGVDDAGGHFHPHQKSGWTLSNFWKADCLGNRCFQYIIVLCLWKTKMKKQILVCPRHWPFILAQTSDTDMSEVSNRNADSSAAADT